MNTNKNNEGREVVITHDMAGQYIEVYATDERGRKGEQPLLSCFVDDGETESQAVERLLEEFQHPFGAAWEASGEEYGEALEVATWLSDYYKK